MIVERVLTTGSVLDVEMDRDCCHTGSSLDKAQQKECSITSIRDKRGDLQQQRDPRMVAVSTTMQANPYGGPHESTHCYVL
jgi:hypothetical protein